jgi:hypothetical protein
LRIIVEVGAFGGQRWREAVVVLVVLLLEPPQRLLREGRDVVDVGRARGMVIDEKMWFCWELGEADASDQKAFGGSILGYELDGLSWYVRA